MKNKVRDVMTFNVITIHPYTTFIQACRIFEEFNIHHLPITNEHNKVIGLFSTSDALNVYTHKINNGDFNKQEETVASLKVEDLINNQTIFSIEPDACIDEALKSLEEHKVHSLLVLEDNKILGILTTNDLLNFYREQ